MNVKSFDELAPKKASDLTEVNGVHVIEPSPEEQSEREDEGDDEEASEETCDVTVASKRPF